MKHQAAATLAALALGALLGAAGHTPPQWLPQLLLHALVALAGYDLGLALASSKTILREAAATGAALAATTLAASTAAAAATGLLLGDPPGAAAAIGAAAGWYTLAAPALAPHSPALAAKALIANQLREALHIAAYPILARRGLSLEAIAIGGATTMDTGLPVVMLNTGPRETTTAIIHGATITILAPTILSILLQT